LEENGLEIGNPKYIYNPDSEIAAGVQKIIWDQNLANKNQNIGLVIGSKLERNKWPLSYFKRVAEHYGALEYRILIFGGPTDKVNAEALASEINRLTKCVFSNLRKNKGVFCKIFCCSRSFIRVKME